MKLNKSGFTLIELLLSMSLFSLVMVITTAGFIGINRTFAKGVIRKQLSESVQNVTADITATLRATGQQAGSEPSYCTPSSAADCPKNGWYAICLPGLRYIWRYTVANSTGGLYKDSNVCSAVVDTSATNQLLDSGRYTVRSLSITPAQDGLFMVAGVFTTNDTTALNGVDLTTQQIANPGNLTSVFCKGTSETAGARSCATQSFSFLVNSRQNGGV